jgi:hypothetical protein
MRLVILPAILVLGCAVAAAAPGESPLKISLSDTLLELQEGNSPVLQYKYRSVPFKPYAMSWFTPKGVNVLRDAPEDHKHHHSLMYAIMLGDINFWEEIPEAGRQLHRTFANVSVDPKRAGFTETLVWQGPKRGKIMLFEQRRLTHHLTDGGSARLLTWQSELKCPKGEEHVTLAGKIYHGLGMRFPVFMDKVGSFQFAQDETGAFDDGPHHLAQASWCAYTVADGEHPVTVAMFSAKENPRPTLWFTMLEPFSYLAGTFDLSRNPITLEAGKTLTAKYGLAAWDGIVDNETVQALYEQWQKILENKDNKHPRKAKEHAS